VAKITVNTTTTPFTIMIMGVGTTLHPR
jgi:hypothetical protein